MKNITHNLEPVLQAKGLMKRYGTVVAMNGADFDLYPNEVLGVIGDNGAGKTTLIRAISGATAPDHGVIELDGKLVNFHTPDDARNAGIETVYQNLALSPALSIADNMFLGREIREKGIMGKLFRKLDHKQMETFARDKLSELGLLTIQNINQAVETLSGGQRQGVAVARAAAFGSKVVIMDEPTAALGVQETEQVENIIRQLKEQGEPLILVSHNMRQVFDLVDRIVVFRRGQICANLDIKNGDYTGEDVVAYITGAKTGAEYESTV